MLPAIGLGCLGLMCVAGRKRHRRRGKVQKPCAIAAPRRGQSCPPMPWIPDEVTSVMNDLWAGGARDPASIAVETLRRVYPTSPDGQSLRWPTSPADCSAKRALESRVIIRAERLVAEALDQAADQLWIESGGY